MSKHWNPDDEIARWKGADDLSRPRKASLPEGALAGLVMVAATCLAVGVVFYQVAGTRDVVVDGVVRR